MAEWDPQRTGLLSQGTRSPLERPGDGCYPRLILRVLF